MTRVVLLFTCAFLVAMVLGCAKRELRGKSVRSADGKTYLVVDHDNGGGCGPIQIDNREWPHPIHTAGEIGPGLHRISCGDSGSIEVTIQPGATFHFDYWGP